MRLRSYIAIVLMFLFYSAKAQTSFVASWDFEGNRNGNSNSPNVTASSLNLSGINELGFPAGATGNAVSLGGWSITNSPGDYVEFSVSPQAYRMSITSVSFDANRTAQGPTELVIRSSSDGYSSNIGSMAVGTGFSGLNIGLSLTGIEATTSFRIYAYSAPSASGGLRLDNLKINGTVTLVPLPVELISFKAQSTNNQIEIAWETAWERIASHFEVQRSTNLQEFSTLKTVLANGNTRERSSYIFIDESPLVGINYYRLRQIDLDGQFMHSKIITAQLNTETPQIFIHQNPTSKSQIKLRLYLFEINQIKVFNEIGQEITLQTEQNSSDDFTLNLSPNTTTGIYFVVAQSNQYRVSKRVLVME